MPSSEFALRRSTVRAKLARDEPVLVVSSDLHDASVVELAALLGFDVVWLDMEHVSVDPEMLQSLVRAARVGDSDVLVRVPYGEPARISRVLEAGAQGVIVPHCRTRADAAGAVAWAKFPPLGARPAFGQNPDGLYGLVPFQRYIEESNDQTFVVMIIEEPEALENLDEIASTPGVDVLYFGPGDFSAAIGAPGARDDARVKAAREEVAAAAARAGIHWGTGAADTDEARRLLEQGARFITHGRDRVWVRQGLQRVRETFAPLGFFGRPRGT